MCTTTHVCHVHRHCCRDIPGHPSCAGLETLDGLGGSKLGGSMYHGVREDGLCCRADGELQTPEHVRAALPCYFCFRVATEGSGKMRRET